MSAKAVGSGLVLIVAVGFFGLRTYLRMERNERRDQRLQQAEAARAALPAECLAHAHSLVDQAPDFKEIGEYLHKAVDTNHQAAYDACGDDSLVYRDKILDLVHASAQKEGQEVVMRAVDKLRLHSRAAGAEWWKLKRKLS